ncbi:MAG: aspartate kinase [Crocosphaera sp.]|nr:aspartate kinase [Crocosphaera sp.]
MTTQILSRSSSETLNNSKNQGLEVQNRDSQMKQVRRAYSVAQQVKYLHLEAEIDVLLQQLKTLKQS